MYSPGTSGCISGKYSRKTVGRFIAELLQNWGEVHLFTRPRRFGKSLNMSMLKSFFEIGSDKALFEGVKITQEKALCEEYMGRKFHGKGGGEVAFFSCGGYTSGNGTGFGFCVE
ncbi:AAA family ATPase [Lacrimispora saccharolytica]|nr:AAA family ATPase [Lacrimispora saccharolytica]